MTRRTTLIVPGLHGSGPDHWQQWWAREHDNTVVIEQDDWSRPDETKWLAVLERAVQAHPGSLLVAHSLGSILVAKLGATRASRFVGGALLVAPADITRTSTLHRRTYEFGAMPTARLPFPSLVVASRNDEYMPFSKITELAKAWGSRFHDLGNAGHVNIPSGYGRWTEGYRLAAQVSDHAAVG